VANVRLVIFSDNENPVRDLGTARLPGVDPFSFTTNGHLYSLKYAFVRALYQHLEGVSDDVITITEN